MDPKHFDLIAKALATRRSRRSALTAGVVGIVGAAAAAVSRPAGRSEAQSAATPAAAAEAMAANNSTLFVQTAIGGTFQPNPDATSASPAASGTGTARHGAYRLTLAGHSGETIYFADRPQRTYGEVKTPRFFTSMGFTPFDPPNAALVVDTPAQADDILLVELFDPTYDAGSQVLTYEADILPHYHGEVLQPLASKQQDERIAAQFDGASLFIDDCPDISTCYTLGVAPAGPVPGGPIGTCWNPWELLCLPCNGDSIQFLEQMCNQTYPDKCADSCVVYTA